MWLMFPPLSVACFPHRRGREGERSAIIILWNMHESILQIYYIKKQSRAVIHWKSNMFISRVKSRHYSENLKARRSLGCWCWHKKKYQLKDTFILYTYLVCKKLIWQGLITTESTKTWHLRWWQTKGSTARQQGNTVTYNHNTAVNEWRWCSEFCFAKSKKTRHTAWLFICWQAKLRRLMEIGCKTGRRCRNHLPL